MAAYYNEIDPYAAQWLRNLIAAGLIPEGDVDERSIVDVQPDDLRGYVQCHFFAGIGGWAYAARLAGWPDDRELWTGSCPCQPFSVAGKQRGLEDERHLWPEFRRLISARRPSVVMGEQVAAAVGKAWLDTVCDDLEADGYEVGAAVLPACSVGAPQRRDRLWFVADCLGARGPRLEPPEHLGTYGQWGWRGKADLCEIYDNLAGHSSRPKPLLCGLDDGLSSRVGRLRAYGNAIVPQVAAEVIAAYMERE
jgi:DNA (cytosine-5)-methyltransferase 1